MATAMSSTLSQVCAAPGAVVPVSSSCQHGRALCRIALAPIGLGGSARLLLVSGNVKRVSSRRRMEIRAVGIRALGAGKSQDGTCTNSRQDSRMPQVLLQLVDEVRKVAEIVRQFMLATPFPKPRTADEAALAASLKGSLILSAAPLFFAATSVSTPLTVVASGMAKWLELYSGVLMVRVLLSWFPNIPWERQPLQAMRDMCDPYLNLFRNIIPPIFNALDVSPMLAFLVLGTLTSILNTSVQA